MTADRRHIFSKKAILTGGVKTKPLLLRFFSNLVGEAGPRILGVKDPRVYFLETLSALLTFFRFLQCLFVMYPIHLFQ